MALYPVFHPHVAKRMGVHKRTGGEYRHKHINGFYVSVFSRITHGKPRPVHHHSFAVFVELAHIHRVFFPVFTVLGTKLGIHITVRMARFIFLPQQAERHPFLLHLPIDVLKVDFSFVFLFGRRVYD